MMLERCWAKVIRNDVTNDDMNDACQFLYYFLEAPPLYLVCWNESQVAEWIDKLVIQDYYNDTLVLETLQTVNKDVSSFCVPAV